MHANLLSRTLLSVTLLAFVAATVPAPARAGIIGTASSVATAATLERSANLARIESQLARADVQAQLLKFGVAPSQAHERIAALTDEEVASLAQRIDQAPAGGDVGLFAVLGIVFVVLLVLDYTGTIHIFSHRR
jgi:TRAP-type C4-dicarboxylate transport system permease large subunit